MEFFVIHGPSAGLVILLVLFSIFSVVFKVWMLVDAVQRPVEDFRSPETRTWWIVGLAVGFLLSVVGFVIAVAYYVSVRRPAMYGATIPAAGGLPGAPPTPSPAPNCRVCGAKIVAGARFCHSCGTPI